MASIARIGDSVQGTCKQPGHANFNPPQTTTGTITGGSSDTFNSSGLARKGDSVALNCIDTRTGLPTGHTTTITEGLSTVKVNNIQLARVGDKVGNDSDFTGSISAGSSNTNAG